jgi:gliding motility-associated-like protein
MKQFLLCLCLFLILKNTVRAQVDCSNIGFEKGNLQGWSTSHGTMTDDNTKTIYSADITGTTGTLHTITSLTDGNDPKVSSIPMVAPGSTHSIRLGNTSVGGDFARITSDYLVTADNTLFQYKFAVVLQNTGADGRASHEPFQKPGFNIQIFDSKGAVLPCSNYDIQLQGIDAVEGFQVQGDIQYRNWTTGAIDLANYVGKTITIVVTAHGCTRQRHFGYAYFDAQCLKTEIKPQSACPDADGLMTLIAPDGFGKYTWSNGATTQTTRVPARRGDKYQVKLVPLASLDESCALQLEYTLKYQEAFSTMDSTICEGSQVVVGDTAYKTTGTFVRKVTATSVCDSTVTLHLKVNPIVRYTQTLSICEGDSVSVGDTTYTTTGVYIKKLVAFTKCDSIVTTKLTVVPLDLTVGAEVVSIVQGDSVRISAIIDPKGQYNYRWEPATSLSCVNCAEPWSKPERSVKYTIYASDLAKACNKNARVNVIVKPCGVYVPEAFSPNQDGNNEVLLVYATHCIKRIQKMTIYNRWGEVVYQRQDFSASDQSGGWDGMYHGLLSAPGVYPYKIQAEMTTGKVAVYNGVVSLIR